MRKKLITAIIVLMILVIGAVGGIVFMETRDPAEHTGESSPGVSTPNNAEESHNEITEATVGISLPTETPGGVGPEVTFGPEDTPPVQTVDPDMNQDDKATADPDENETPGMPL